jgi:hypothetical protein
MKIPFFLMRAHAKRTWFRTLLTITSVFFAVLIFGALRTFIVGMESTLSEANPSRMRHVGAEIEPQRLFRSLYRSQMQGP